MLETAWESRWLPDPYGGVAQLGEHLPCKQGVMSSNLTISTLALSYAQVAGLMSRTLYIENRILIKILKYQKFVKQTRDKQDIRG